MNVRAADADAAAVVVAAMNTVCNKNRLAIAF